LSRVPDSTLLFKFRGYESARVQERILNVMDAHGVTRERIVFEGHSPHAEVLETYNRVDLALDTWPFSGGLTTCEALWMGVPVLTHPSDTFTGRHSLTHLKNVGLDDWVAADFDEYIGKAVSWARSLDELAALRGRLREQVRCSPLCDGPRFARNLEWALWAMWRGTTTAEGTGG